MLGSRARAAPKIAAASARVSWEFVRDATEHRTRPVDQHQRPAGEPGHVGQRGLQRPLERVAQRSEGAARYAARNRIGNCRDRATSPGRRAAPRPAPRPRPARPASSKLRRFRSSAMYPMDGMSADHRSPFSTERSRSAPQGERVLPGHPGRPQRLGAEQDRAVRRPARARSSALARDHRQLGRDLVPAVVPAVHRVPVTGASLPGAVRAVAVARVDQLDHVAEAHGAGRESYLSSVYSVYSSARRAAMPRLTGFGIVRPVRCPPVGQQPRPARRPAAAPTRRLGGANPAGVRAASIGIGGRAADVLGGGHRGRGPHARARRAASR